MARAGPDQTLRQWLSQDEGGRRMLEASGDMLALDFPLSLFTREERELMELTKHSFDVLAMVEWAAQQKAPTTPKKLRPRCGARCRDGHPCQAPAVWDSEHDRPRNGRCRMHGGLSTGPRTEEGKRRSREGAKLGARVSVERRSRGKRGEG